MDLAKIKAMKQKYVERNGGGGSSDFWKPTVTGKTHIRIVPFKADPDRTIRAVDWHYGIGKHSIPCLGKDECPVCALATEFWNSESAEDKELAKKMFARTRFYAPVAVRKPKSEELEFDTIKWWAFSKTVFESIANAYEEDDNIDDLKNGRDFIIEYKTKEDSSTQFPSTAATPSFKQSPLSTDVAVMKKLVNEQKDLDDIIERKSADEIVEILEKWTSGDTDTIETKKTEPVTTKVEDPDDLEAEFDKLMNTDED